MGNDDFAVVEAALTGECARCGGRRTISVRHGMGYDTDSAEERAENWHKEPCPLCMKPALSALARCRQQAQERERALDSAILDTEQAVKIGLGWMERAQERDAEIARLEQAIVFCVACSNRAYRIAAEAKPEAPAPTECAGPDSDFKLVKAIIAEHPNADFALEGYLALASISRQATQLRAELAAANERAERMREEHDCVIGNLAVALFPNSPPDSARAEFMLDAMGACQVIDRLRKQRDTAQAGWREVIEALRPDRGHDPVQIKPECLNGETMHSLRLGEVHIWRFDNKILAERAANNLRRALRRLANGKGAKDGK